MSALPGSEAAVFAFGPFVLDRDRRMLERDGAQVAVTPKAFDLLVVLVEGRGAAVAKDELMARLWPDTVVEESNLTFQVSTLRKALGADGARYIATLPGRGYQFTAPVVTTIVEDEERTTITLSETRRPALAWVAALVLLVAGAVAAMLFLRREPAAPRALPPGVRSLAVLPFKPLAAAQRDEALELGMADTLITRLSGMPDVIVRPVGAVRRYTELDADPLAAARDLGVDAVVDGSIQRRGQRMRVTVRLLRAADGRPLWASQFDDDARDLFAVQDHVAEQVARAVTDSAQPRVAKPPAADLEAYELYLKGRFWMNADNARAREFYQRAIDRDPRFAAAWAAMADAWIMRGRFGNDSPRAEFEKAREAAVKAVAIDPQSAEGHAALAQVYADHDWDWDRAESEFRRALALNPNSDVAHGQYAYLLLFRRDFARALTHSRRATQIDPVAPGWAVVHAQVLGASGRTEEAIAHLEEALRVHPKLIPALLHLGLLYTTVGKPETALARLHAGLAVHPRSSQLLGVEAYVEAKAGHRERALAIIHGLEQLEAPPSHSIALAWTALGDRDRAFAWLERAYRDRLPLLRVVTVADGFEPLRADPRYAGLVRRMGL